MTTRPSDEAAGAPVATDQPDTTDDTATTPAPGARRGWGEGPGRIVLFAGAVVLASALATVFYLMWSDWPFWSIDFESYRTGANTVLTGGHLYEVTTAKAELFYNYTPLSAVLFIPLVILPYSLTTAVWIGLELLFLQLTVWTMLDALGVHRTKHRAIATALVSAAALTVFAVDIDLRLGQINLLLMFLVLFDLVRGEGRRWQGVLIGFAAGIKLVPLFYVGYLLVTGRTRAALRALGVFAAMLGLGFAILPSDSAVFWSGSGTAMNPELVGEADNLLNQSLRGMIARLTDGDASYSLPWIIAALCVGAAGLTAAAVLHRRGLRLRAILVCALTTVLVSPVSWEHHWVWVVPVLLFIAAHAWQERSARWWVLFAATLTMVTVRFLDMAMPEPAKPGESLDEVRQSTADALSAATALVDGFLLPNCIVLTGLVLLCVLAFPAVVPQRSNTTGRTVPEPVGSAGQPGQ